MGETGLKDIGVAVRQYLLNDSTVAALVGDRVFVDDLPEEEDEHMPRNAVVLRSAGGPESRDWTHLQRQRYDVLCYGATRYDAGEVDGAVAETLHYLKRTVVKETLLSSVMVGGGAQSFKDAQTGWPIKLRTILVYGSMKTAS